MKRIYRSRTERILGGVCGGMGEYLNVDPVFIRLLFVLLIFAGGSGIILYIVAWLIIPEEPASVKKISPSSVSEKPTGTVMESFVREVEEAAEGVEQHLGQAVEHLEKKSGTQTAQRVIGILLIFIGLFLLLAKFVDLSWLWEFFWPLVLLFVGLMLLFSAWREGIRPGAGKP